MAWTVVFIGLLFWTIIDFAHSLSTKIEAITIIRWNRLLKITTSNFQKYLEIDLKWWSLQIDKSAYVKVVQAEYCFHIFEIILEYQARSKTWWSRFRIALTFCIISISPAFAAWAWLAAIFCILTLFWNGARQTAKRVSISATASTTTYCTRVACFPATQALIVSKTRRSAKREKIQAHIVSQLL